MALQEVLKNIDPLKRFDFLRSAYRPGRTEVTEALLKELEVRLKDCGLPADSSERKEFDAILGDLQREALKAGDTERVRNLKMRQITAHFYSSDIAEAAKSADDPVIMDRVIAAYRGKNWSRWGLVVNLLEHQGKKDAARDYMLEAAQALDIKRKAARKHGGKWANHSVDEIYVRLGMRQEALEVRLDNADWSEALALAQELFKDDALSAVYKRIYDADHREEYHQGFPVKVQVARLLNDPALVQKTKADYARWMANQEVDTISVDMIRKDGTAEQLRQVHARRVDYYQGRVGQRVYDRMFMAEDMAVIAAEAYEDTKEKKYAALAEKYFTSSGNFPKMLEYARISDPVKAGVLESLL